MLDKVSEKNKKNTGGKTRERRSDSEENAAHSGWSLNELRSIMEGVWGDETACSGNPRRHLTNLILLSMILYDNKTASRCRLSPTCSPTRLSRSHSRIARRSRTWSWFSVSLVVIREPRTELGYRVYSVLGYWLPALAGPNENEWNILVTRSL